MESFLIPTKADHADAHEDTEQEVLYQQKLEQLSQKDENGNLKYPWTFEVVKGFFKQSEDDTDDLNFNYATSEMGRLKPWAEILEEINQLNENAKDNESYKLLFLARHGQGHHNVVINKYGYDEWHRYWYNQTHDGDVQYAPDPMLTELGIKQAQENHQLWKSELAKGAPIPHKFYVSPLQRSSHTLVYTWGGLKLEDTRPVVTELIRETCGMNVCDKRSSKTVISERFSKHGFEFEDGFTEEDEFFKYDWREQLHHHTIRINGFLQKLFEEDYDQNTAKVVKSKAQSSSVISTTSHAGSIRCFIMALGHRHFTISTGGMIPVVVKARRS